MSQVKIQGGASGSDNYTILAPATSTGDKTLTLPTATATLASTDANTFTGVQTFPAGSVSAPAITTTGDTNTGVYFPAADSVAITTGGTAAVTVDSGQRTKFPTTIGIGNATPSTSGCGITFPASENLSTNGNTLDDYEEGTWTTSFTNYNCSSTTLSDATYTKVGRLVTLIGKFSSTLTTTATDTQIVFTLPFGQRVNLMPAVGSASHNLAATYAGITVVADSSGASNTSAAVSFPAAQVTKANGSSFTVEFTYVYEA